MTAYTIAHPMSKTPRRTASMVFARLSMHSPRFCALEKHPVRVLCGLISFSQVYLPINKIHNSTYFRKGISHEEFGVHYFINA